MSLLQVSDLDVHYGDFQAIYGLDLSVEEGETLATLNRCLPRASLRTLPLGGRTLPRAQPDSVNAAVREFMQAAAP